MFTATSARSRSPRVALSARPASRVKTDPETLELFAATLAADDQVTLEATGNALAIARIIEPYVGRVVLADPRAVRGSASNALRPIRSMRARWRGYAVVAVARKLLVIAWHMLNRDEEYAYTRPSLMREKIRRLELLTGTGPARGNRGATRIYASRRQRDLELELVRQAERAYARLVKDWQPAIKKGAGAAPGRASSAVERQAARQETAPPPAL